jgi:hypothetical protein
LGSYHRMWSYATPVSKTGGGQPGGRPGYVPIRDAEPSR